MKLFSKFSLYFSCECIKEQPVLCVLYLTICWFNSFNSIFVRYSWFTILTSVAIMSLSFLFVCFCFWYRRSSSQPCTRQADVVPRATSLALSSLSFTLDYIKYVFLNIIIFWALNFICIKSYEIYHSVYGFFCSTLAYRVIVFYLNLSPYYFLLLFLFHWKIGLLI